jgi:proline iminopeptidase
MRRLQFLILISCYFLTQIIAISSEAVCSPDGICQIKRPLTQLGFKTFKYKFKIKKGEPGYPTIIFIPGGPGDTSMNRDSLIEVPHEYTVIFTDPRGAGENTLPINANLSKAVTSERIASDITSIVKTMKLQNYIIYGTSYGTVPATIAASKLSKIKKYAPKALVLSGTVGHSMTGESDGVPTYLTSMISEWNQIRDNLSKTDKNEFDKKIEKALQDKIIARGDFGAFIQIQLILRSSGTENNLLLAIITDLARKNQSEVNSTLKIYIKNITQMINSDDEIHRILSCQEIVPNIIAYSQDVIYQGGLLPNKAARSYCDGLTFKHSYDSAKYQVRAPIFYFQGAHDPAVSTALAKYHFANQKTDQKVFVLTPDDGHLPLSHSLLHCMPQIWISIFSGAAQKTDDIARNCQSPAALSTFQSATH